MHCMSEVAARVGVEVRVRSCCVLGHCCGLLVAVVITLIAHALVDFVVVVDVPMLVLARVGKPRMSW